MKKKGKKSVFRKVVYEPRFVKKSENNERKKFFIFEDASGLIIKAQTAYVNGISKVNAKELIDNIRALKTLINME